MNRSHCVLFGSLIAAFVLTGCGSSQMGRIEASRALYETWPIETRQAVLDGKVEPGMNPDMVQVAWGKPTEIVNKGGSEEIWVYRTGGSAPIIDSGLGGSGTSISSSNSGIGVSGGTTMGIGGMGGMGGGVGGPRGAVLLPGTPEEVKEVVFRNGVVHRADAPTSK